MTTPGRSSPRGDASGNIRKISRVAILGVPSRAQAPQASNAAVVVVVVVVVVPQDHRRQQRSAKGANENSADSKPGQSKVKAADNNQRSGEKAPWRLP
jgi:hypothetical protein